MFNARDLLGQVMQTAMTDTTAHRMRHALGPSALGRADAPLAKVFGGSGQGGGVGGALGGLAGMAESMLGDAGRSVQRGSPLAVGGLGALAGALLGGGGGAVRGALGGGVLALLGGIAMSALRNHRAGTAPLAPEEVAQAAPLGLREPRDGAEEEELQRRAQLVLRAMISAAKADGQIDQGEVQRIVGKLEEDGASDEARAFVLEEMRRPADLDRLIGEARDPEVAVEVYAASLLAIEVDTPAEREYLRRLAQDLHLTPATVRRIHQALDVPVAT
jgi:uncharacterized membrane protein YebE (DUF533 family)